MIKWDSLRKTFQAQKGCASNTSTFVVLKELQSEGGGDAGEKSWEIR